MKSAQHFIAAALAAVLFTGTAAAGDPLRIEHPDKRTTEIPVEHPAAWLMLPIEEAAPEVPVEILAADEVLQRLHIRLAQFEVDYYMPLRASDYPGADRIRVLNHHRNALAWSRIYSADRYDLPDERYRPAYHFAPAYGWMNDPNGMFYLDGVWHLFYQHNPYGAMWGNMHWGSATSRDLVTWEHHGDALCPDELGTIFSGSAVVDHDNTAGFGKGAVLAFYTSAGRYQQQSMAYSTDGGKSFTKYEGNPVVASQLGDCRDPKVFWYAPGKHWNMILAVGNHMEIYSSPDLKQWKHESDFGAGYGGHDGIWECPDLFELPVDGDPDNTRWVLLSNNYSNTLRSGGTQYFIGTFDGREFRCETPSDLTRWLDKGRNHYAAVTWDNAPENRRVLLAWLAGWPYQDPQNPVRIRGIQSVPRDLSLYTHEGTVYLAAEPAPRNGSAARPRSAEKAEVRSRRPERVPASRRGALRTGHDLPRHRGRSGRVPAHERQGRGACRPLRQELRRVRPRLLPERAGRLQPGSHGPFDRDDRPRRSTAKGRIRTGDLRPGRCRRLAFAPPAARPLVGRVFRARRPLRHHRLHLPLGPL